MSKRTQPTEQQLKKQFLQACCENLGIQNFAGFTEELKRAITTLKKSQPEHPLVKFALSTVNEMVCGRGYTYEDALKAIALANALYKENLLEQLPSNHFIKLIVRPNAEEFQKTVTSHIQDFQNLMTEKLAELATPPSTSGFIKSFFSFFNTATPASKPLSESNLQTNEQTSSVVISSTASGETTVAPAVCSMFAKKRTLKPQATGNDDANATEMGKIKTTLS